MIERGGSQALARQSPAIQVEAIGRRDPRTGTWLIRDVSFVVEFGDRIGVVGPSGAGKTVLLRAMAMLDKIDEGTILWQGSPVRGAAVPLFRSRVVYLHQRPALVDGTVEDNLRQPFRLAVHGGRSYERDRALALFDALSRDASFLDKSSRELSGGEAQLTALVRALQLEPAVLLLDEPAASLDPATTRSVEVLLEQWIREQAEKRAFVWVSHDQNQTLRMTDRRLRLSSGRLEAEN
jgi:putative ABC transport system ATP-binding protein